MSPTGSADGFVLPPGAGTHLGAATLKSGADITAAASTFETNVAPGFDIGAHVHREHEEFFFVIEGELNLLAFEPRTRTSGGWESWESRSGDKFVRGGPGSFMFVPAGCPHAFANPGPEPVRMIFQVTPAGHERYLAELAELLATPGPPDQIAIIALRRKYDIDQLTPLISGRSGLTAASPEQRTNS